MVSKNNSARLLGFTNYSIIKLFGNKFACADLANTSRCDVSEYEVAYEEDEDWLCEGPEAKLEIYSWNAEHGEQC